MAKAGETQDRCTQYALDVVSGKITAGEYVRLACQRHLDDIEKSKAAPYKYYFDVEKSEEIINFAEELTIAEGEENEHVTAYPFQCFILGSLNGWRTKEKSYRRFRTSYVQLGRHQWYFGVLLRQFRRVQVRKNILYGDKARPGKHCF